MSKETNLEFRFKMPEIQTPVFLDRDYNIRDYGAIGNGIHLNTTAITQAIDECSSLGGGRVIIPKGLWATGPIHLKSNVNLYSEEGAIINFSKNFDDYALILSNYEGLVTMRCTSPIMGVDLENVAITGEGIFDGCGEVWRAVKKSKVNENHWNKLVKSGGVVEEGREPIWWPSQQALDGRDYDTKMEGKCTDEKESLKYKHFFRPVLMNLVNCKKVLIDGPTFQNSPAWCLHPRACEHMTIRNIKVRNPWFSQNGDGIDIESCKYVILSNSVFDVGDDAICIKSGKNEEGRRLAKATEFVSIKDCTVYHGHGGVVIGSEMSAGVKNMEVLRCTFIGTDTGLRFKSCRGRGGVVENIYIDGVNMKDIVNEAITFSTAYNIHVKALEESTPEDIPEFRNFLIKNVNCVGAGIGIYLSGLPEMPISNVHFEDIIMKSKKGIQCENGKDIFMKNVIIIDEENTDISFNSKCINNPVERYQTLF